MSVIKTKIGIIISAISAACFVALGLGWWSQSGELRPAEARSYARNLTAQDLKAAPRFSVWANDGGDKVAQEELRATASPASIVNSVWPSMEPSKAGVSIFGARNETVSFNLIIEAPQVDLKNVSVEFNELRAKNGKKISSRSKRGDDLFNTVGRPIELFYVRYLQIKGLSRLSYEVYDERHIPRSLQRPWSGAGHGKGKWKDRPGADKHLPEIAVPIELVGRFDVASKTSQSIWADVFIPKGTKPGIYLGAVKIQEGSKLLMKVPVKLEVKNFTLPDHFSSKTMVYLGYPDIGRRYVGTAWPNANTPEELTIKRVRDRHFQMAHRHRISLIDKDPGGSRWPYIKPRPEWMPRLDGSLFTPRNGYAGPAEGVGNDVYSIGTYGSWPWKTKSGHDEIAMSRNAYEWEKWFATRFPKTERFLYLIDESTDYPKIQSWAKWAKDKPYKGRTLPTFATANLPDALKKVPDLSYVASWFSVAEKSWESAHQTVLKDPNKKFMMYNGKRPAVGSFAIEDDGIALRSLPWAQFKKKVSRWFFWESTYYNNYQAGEGETNVFRQAHTFGKNSKKDSVLGRTGWNYSNGDGVLFYPGTDQQFPNESYGIEGPIASLRLKHWRRGIQDVEYLELAKKKSPARVQKIVNKMVPKVLWEYGVSDKGDPTWVRSDVSWPTDPEKWEQVRRELAELISKKGK